MRLVSESSFLQEGGKNKPLELKERNTMRGENEQIRMQMSPGQRIITQYILGYKKS